MHGRCRINDPATAIVLREFQIPMHRPIAFSLLAGFLMMSLAGCGDVATLPENAGVGPRPALPPPHQTLIPTVLIAPAKGWPAGATPVAAAGLAVSAYAVGLDHPRWLYVLPNGDVPLPRAMARLGRMIWAASRAG